VIELSHEKAITEPKYSKMYALLFKKFKENLPEENNVPKAVLDLCKKVYDEAIPKEPSRELLESKNVADREDLIMSYIRERTKKIGNIVLIGELFLAEIFGTQIAHNCIINMLSNTEELNLELLCALIRTCGQKVDTSKARHYVDQYFERIESVMKEKTISSRIRFMLQDIVELRNNNWKPRKIVETQTLANPTDKPIQSSVSYTLNSYGSFIQRTNIIATSSPSAKNPVGVASSSSPSSEASLSSVASVPALSSDSDVSIPASIPFDANMDLDSFLGMINPLLQDFYKLQDVEQTLSILRAFSPQPSPDLQSTLIYNLIVESLENQSAWTASKNLISRALSTNVFPLSSFSIAFVSSLSLLNSLSLSLELSLELSLFLCCCLLCSDNVLCPQPSKPV